jgi:cysteinyl-tRNA synthetase
MKIFDTLSGTKKELVNKSDGKPINLFVCGPTVYDYPHIGNARTFVMFDILIRYLRSRGFNIFYLQNITNVDDKIIQRAIDEKTTWDTVADKFEKAFYEYNTLLGITSVDKFAKSTEFIPQVIAQVQTLIKKGHAYKIEGDGWYFDLKTFPQYGKLSRRTMEQAETSVEQGTSRVDNSDKKRNAGDFCLWKFSKENEPSWPSPELGEGRPGWHIEDTATTEHFFGPQYDIHGGALDLKFPHHEAELTQQEAASGKSPFVNFWMHAGFLTINGQKMSKSLGNFMTVGDLLKNTSADVFRMMLLMHHYRAPLDYTPEVVHSAEKVLHDLNILLAKLAKSNGEPTKKKIDIAGLEKEFHEAMDDDFNTLKALAVVAELVSATNKQIWALSEGQAQQIAGVLKKLFASVGITLAAPVVPENVLKLATDRELSRVSKQFTQSDALRAQIEQLGYGVEDTPAGPLVLPKR